MARRTLSTKRPDTLTQTALVHPLFACNRAADHTLPEVLNTVYRDGELQFSHLLLECRQKFVQQASIRIDSDQMIKVRFRPAEFQSRLKYRTLS